MKKIVCYILLANLIIIVLIIYAKYFNYSKRIDIKFIDKIQFDEPITEILPDYYFYPRLYCIKKDDFFTDTYINTIFQKSSISEKKIKEFKSLFDSLPQKSYIYVCAGKKLKCIYYSDDSGSYGYNGNYSLRNYDCVFIYWSTQQIGNFIDGYI